MKQRLVVLHGFAGHPNDWAPFAKSFAGWPLYKINLFQKMPEAFDVWAQRLVEELQIFDGRQVLLGYSMGGRLAAQLLLKAPQLFAAAIFISTHPGLTTQSERDDRKLADQRWAEKWRSAPWPVLQAEWNAQSAFRSGHAKPLSRRESDFDRELLARAMVTWSLGEQADLQTLLSAYSKRQLWMAGEDDQKFVKLAEVMAELSDQSDAVIIPHAGHRVPWDNPAAFTASVSSFLESL